MASEDEPSKSSADSARVKVWQKTLKLLSSSVGKICVFLFIAMPIWFIMIMYAGGHLMANVQGWEFLRGYNFMASAITGGAIVFPADPPNRFSSKILATIAGASGVGLFGFMVAVLSNSVAEPIVQVFGLKQESDKGHHVFGKLGGLAAIVVVMNLIMASIFGYILTLVEPSIGLIPAFKAIASMELGGGVVFAGQGAPSTSAGSLWYCVIGVWAIGVASLMIAVVGGPGVSVVEEASGVHLEEGEKPKSAAKKLAGLVIVALPLVLLGAMLLVACVMHTLTPWEFRGAFWAGLPATTGGACALASSSNPPLTESGMVILICAASAGFFMISLAIGVGGELMSPIVNMVPYLATKKTVPHALFSLFAIAYVMIPFCVMLFAVPIGGIISYAEGWQFYQGFWWCVAVQLGGGMALTSVQIEHVSGMLLATVAVAWSIGISILSVGLSGAPVVEPLMDAMGMTVDADELAEILGKDHRKIAGKQTSTKETDYGSTSA